MPELNVLRHVVRPHLPSRGEEYDPGGDMLIVVHSNPDDPDDPTEFGHHIRLHGLAYRKEMWGLGDMASTLDQELADLERYYARRDDLDYGVHPLADMTHHYFETPPVQMASFAPEYVLQKVAGAVLPVTTDAVMNLCLGTVTTGLDDVRSCLGSSAPQTFPCKGMTGLSTKSVDQRERMMDRMAEQTQQLDVIPCEPLDAIRQALTDRESELDAVRAQFVDRTLLDTNVPEIMRRRVILHAVRKGLMGERAITWN